MLQYEKIITLYFILLSTFCQLSEGKATEANTGRKNTFGCKINGKNWVPSGGGGFSGIKPLSGGYLATYPFNTTSNNIRITAYDESTSIEFYLRDVKQADVYLLNYNTLDFINTQNPQNYGYYEAENGDKFFTNSQYTGKVNVTKADTINKIVSGTFEFTGVNSTGKIVKIKDGRFDVKKQ